MLGVCVVFLLILCMALSCRNLYLQNGSLVGIVGFGKALFFEQCLMTAYSQVSQASLYTAAL